MKAYYFKFIDICEIPAKGKTRKFQVINKKHGDVLAEIGWYGPWRQYCFSPEANTVWNSGCLSDILSFLGDLKKGGV